MKKLHEALMEKAPKYAVWHRHPKRNLIQWLVLLLVVGFIGFLFYMQAGTPESERQIASVNTEAANKNRRAQLQNELPSLTRNVLNKSQQLKKASPAAQKRLTAELASLVKQRSDIMAEAVTDNPELVLQNAISATTKAQLPSSVTAGLETQATVEGKLSWITAENPAQGKSTDQYTITNDVGATQPVYFAGNEPDAKNGDKIRITGVELNNQLITSAESSKNVQVLQSPAAPSSDQMNVLAMLVTTSDNRNQTNNAADINNKLFSADSHSVANYYKEISFGKMSVTGTVVGYYNINATYCDINNIATKAKAAAQSAGVNLGAYNKFMYILPQGFCNSNGVEGVGFAQIGGTDAWMYNMTDIFYPSHELGHTLGLHHAQALTCNPGPIEGNCSITEQGDLIDVMGRSMGHMNSFEKSQLGWLGSAGTPPIQTVTKSGTYKIGPYAAPNDSTPRSLRIVKPDGQVYYVESRQPIGYDSGRGSGMYSGLLITVVNESDNRVNDLIDMTPENTSFDYSNVNNPALWDYALPLNRPFNDAVSGITITPKSLDGSGATIEVKIAGSEPCNQFNPTVTITPSNQSGTANSTLGYNFTVQNNDSDACSGSTYTITPSFPDGWMATPSSFTETLEPGTTVSRAINISAPSNATTTNFSISASNIANSMRGSGSATFTIIPQQQVDTTPPTVTITDPPNNFFLQTKSQVQNVSVSAADDSGIDTIEIRLDGNLIKACTNTTTCNTSFNPAQLPDGGHTLEAKAYDKSTNRNSATTTVTMSRKARIRFF